MKRHFSIRYKILALITVLLISCVFIYLALATQVFKQDKTELVYDLNKSLVTNVASEIETEFRGVSAKMDLLAIMWSQKKKSVSLYLKDLLNKDPQIVYVTLVKNGKHINTFYKQDFLDSYNISHSFFKKDISVERPVPFVQIEQSGEVIWNATTKNGPPLIGYGRSVIEEGPDRIPVARHAVVTYLRVDNLVANIATSDHSDLLLLTAEGRVLLSSNGEDMIKATNVSHWPIVKTALETQNVRTSVMNYEQDGEGMLGAYSKSYKGQVIVIATTSERGAFTALQRLITRSVVYATAVATFAFIVAVLFSQSLTGPIERLVAGMSKVSEGDLTTQVTPETSDEIAIMAKSFNSMIGDLKESRAQLEEINRDLEKKVLDRTKKLEEQNRAVKEAQEALLRTTRLASVGEIAGRAAHEVLNPLTNLINRVRKVQENLKGRLSEETTTLSEITSAWSDDYQNGGLEKLVSGWQSPSDVNKDQSLWEEDLNNIQQIKNNWSSSITELMADTDFLLSEGQRINKIVSTMRSLSVVKSNRKSHSIHDLLKESGKIMADLFSQHQVTLKESYDAKFDQAMVDKDEFIQSTINLIRNSIQATSQRENNSGLVEIVTSNNEQGLVIDIVDNGTGIEKQHQPKLFKTQFSTKTHEEGTGFGLGISRRLVRACGGDIVLHESNPNQKTIFRITLPLEESKEKAEVA